MTVAVTGGAGYIGSHMVRQLRDGGQKVIVIDDLSKGFADAVGDAPLFVTDIKDTDAVAEILGDHGVELVMHFASKSEVGESMAKPELYYDSIVGGTASLVQAMRRAGTKRLVFSSTAAVYGEPETELIGENHPKRPLNPYGNAKKVAEDLLADCHRAGHVSSVSLRYFNAAGAAPDGSLGERHDPETHLIPLVLQAAGGRRDSISIFGSDYPTADGTCVRDYIHIEDLCSAHNLAAQRLRDQPPMCEAYNLGNGRGFSVREVIDAVRDVTASAFKVNDAPRRAGDPAVLVADATRATQVLGWQPAWTELRDIVAHAWNWERRK